MVSDQQVAHKFTPPPFATKSMVLPAATDILTVRKVSDRVRKELLALGFETVSLDESIDY